MYRYLEDKDFLHKMRELAGGIMQNLCHVLKEDYDIGSNFYLVGSGARNLIMQNATEPVDLDYDLEIVRCEDFEDCRYIKECVRKAFNKSLKIYNLRDCEDSTSSFSSKIIQLGTGNQTMFKIDICITYRDDRDNYNRLIHRKIGCIWTDDYYWNTAPNSANIKEKADFIKSKGKWELVREQYKNLKNMYLIRNDSNHPSFVCYIEAVNNVYNSRRHW